MANPPLFSVILTKFAYVATRKYNGQNKITLTTFISISAYYAYFLKQCFNTLNLTDLTY